MSTRKIWNGTQWVQIGASINDIEIVTSSAGAVDPSKLYFVASDATPGDLVTFRVNGKLGSGVWFGGNELWTPTQQATGGTETIIDVAGTPYKVHTFTTSGDFEVLIPSLNVEYLCVGGGGNGGGSSAGRGAGGGAGGDVYSSTTILNVGIYNCSVAVASNTAFDTIHTSLKGGDGAVSGTDNGGGGGSNSTASGGAPSSGGGGGGGATAGSPASGGTGGNGAAGTSSSVSGATVVYGSGGGGGTWSGSGAGGSGGSGAGNGGHSWTPAIANRGGGGGGRGGWEGGSPGPGAAGVIIIRYPLA